MLVYYLLLAVILINMKIAYFGYNLFSSCLSVFEKHGHEISAIFTGDDKLHADQIILFSQQHSIPLYFEKPNEKLINELLASGIDCFFSAEYPWCIPIPKPLTYAINVHPTLLPYGRGPTPLSYLLLNDAGHCGITLHKMTNEIDKGDILLQHAIALDSSETYNTLTAKLYLEAPLLLDRLLSSLNNYYENSVTQKTGSYWPSLTKKDQTINWNEGVADILKRYKAFGRLGVYAQLKQSSVIITMLEVALFDHAIKPGSIIFDDPLQVVVAAWDGFISINKSSLIIL